MKLYRVIKRLWTFALNNYFVSIILACITFVILVSGYKLFLKKPTYVYVKIKVGQGLWWATTAKPTYWFVSAIKNAQQEKKDLAGKSIVKIINVTYYPWINPNQAEIINQFDIYVVARLLVTTGKMGSYSFDRSAVAIGAPIDIETPSLQFSGTVIDLSPQPIEDQYQEKIIYLTKQNITPWEYEAIKIDDSYFNGERKVFEVLDKSFNKDVIIKAKIAVKNVNGQLLFGEEQIVRPNKGLTVTTENFSFYSYTITKVE